MSRGRGGGGFGGVVWGGAPPKDTPQKIAPFLKKESVIPEL
jgi:hypothetical protein